MSSARRWPFAAPLVFALGLALRALGLIPSIIDDDEAWFARSGSLLAHPGDYFRVALDNKPPGTAWYYWAVERLGGGADLARAGRLGGLLLVIATAWCLGRLVKKEARSTAALLFLAASVIAHPKLLSVTNESLMLPLFCAAYCLIWPGRRSGERAWAWLAAGACLGAGFLVKQTAIFFVLPALLAARRPRDLGLLLLAAILVAGTGITAVGARDFWHWAFVYPSEVLVPTRARLFSGIGDGFATALQFALVLLPLLLAAAEGPASRPLLAWIAAAIAAIAVGRGLFLHYFLLLVPPLCVLAADRFWTRWRVIWLGTGYLFACLLAAIPACGLFWGTDLEYFTRIAARVQALARPADPVFYWAGNPVPVYLTGRPGVGRFLTARFIAPPYSTPETERLFQKEMLLRPPALLVDLHRRGDNQFGLPPETLPWLASLLRDRYTALADPSLPWARFYLRRDRLAELGPELLSLCPAAPDSPSGTYPRSLQALKRWVASPLFALSSPEKALRASFSLETFDSSCASGLPDWARALQDRGADSDSVRAQFLARLGVEPFALASPTWWVSLAIVELQPAVRVR